MILSILITLNALIHQLSHAILQVTQSNLRNNIEK